MIYSQRAHSERLLFALVLAAHLIPVWFVKYFLTTDGPCHVYNSKVLLDLVTSHHLDFYLQYYYINNNPDPNWFSHVCLAALQLFIPGFLAEKLLVSAYMILFMVAIRQLVKFVNKDAVFLAWAGFPLIYNHALQLGFYNSSFSIIIMLMILLIWLRPAKKPFVRIILLSFLFTLLYFTHLFGLTFTLLFILLLIPWREEWWKHSFSGSLKNCGLQIIQLTIAALPALVLAWFYFNHVGGADVHPSKIPVKKLLHDFIELSALICVAHNEKPFAAIVSGMFGMLFIYCLWQRVSTRRILAADGFLLCFFAAAAIYFTQPSAVAGGSVLQERLQLIPFFIIIPWLATAVYPALIKKISMAVFGILSLVLIAIRIPHYYNASDAMKEIASAGKFINDRSTVLPLGYSYNGKTLEGERIANRIWLFLHAADYLGAEEKSLVMLGNYEANTSYFPLGWVHERNPFNTIPGVEGIPPDPDISLYQHTGGTIDYVILLFLNSDYEHINHPGVQTVLSELNENYELIFTSEHGRAKLYRRLR